MRELVHLARFRWIAHLGMRGRCKGRYPLVRARKRCPEAPFLGKACFEPIHPRSARRIQVRSRWPFAQLRMRRAHQNHLLSVVYEARCWHVRECTTGVGFSQTPVVLDRNLHLHASSACSAASDRWRNDSSPSNHPAEVRFQTGRFPCKQRVCDSDWQRLKHRLRFGMRAPNTVHAHLSLLRWL